MTDYTYPGQVTARTKGALKLIIHATVSISLLKHCAYHYSSLEREKQVGYLLKVGNVLYAALE